MKTGQLKSSIGRKATAYAIIPTAKIAIGIEILPDCVYLIALDLYGQKIAKNGLSLCFEKEERYFEQLKDTVMEFLQSNNIKSDQLLGIGLAIQGLVSQDGSEVTYGEILNCTGLSIKPFAKFFQCPCYFIHDAECAANSELWENRGLSDAIYLSLGLHLGGAIIIEGKLHLGLTGKSGIFEHTTLIPGGKTCYCGKAGCAECYCSANALLGEKMDLKDFFERKKAGDVECNRRWEKYLDHLAMLISNLHTVIENTIVLGGHVTPYFTEEDLTRLRQKVFELYAFDSNTDYILVGKCRYDSVSIGAALPFIKDFLENLSFVLYSD